MAREYICLNCENTFNEDEMGSYSESRDGGNEEFSCCPICKKTDYTDFKEYIHDAIVKAIDNAKGEPQEKYDMAYELFKNKEV